MSKTDRAITQNRLTSVPIELWKMISEYLKSADLKSCRFVSKELNTCTMPILFETVRFSFTEECVQIFEEMTNLKWFVSSVRTIILFRSIDSIYQAFPSFEDWQENLYFTDPRSNQTTTGRNQTMTREEWSNMARSERERLYKEYENERKALLWRKDDFLKRTAQCLQKMKNLSSFRFDPTNQELLDWREEWEHLGKHLGLHEQEDYSYAAEIERDIDAVHLALFMQALGSLRPLPKKLSSMTFELHGPGFLTPLRLRNIWEGFGHGKIRTLTQEYQNAVEADKKAAMDFEEDPAKEYYSTQLNNLRSIITPLKSIDLSIVESYSERSLDTIAGPFADFLCEGKNLTKLILSFGNFGPFFFQNLESYQQLLDYRNNRQDLLALLTTRRPWPALTHIQISIATDSSSLLGFFEAIASNLQSLELDWVTLLPGDGERGRWEYVLPRIRERLHKLNELILNDLRDFSTAGEARKLFNSSEWECCHCYEDFDSNITSYVLGQSELRYSLEKADWLCIHDKSIT
jgi:hypothetical protein